MNRRCFLAQGAAIAAAFAVQAKAESKWPSRPITFIVPSAAGGSPDVLSRLITAQLAKELDASIIVEDRPGAFGIIGTTQIMRAPADGYTIGYGNTNTLAVNRSLYSKLPYDVDKDLVPVAQMLNIANVLVVPADSPDHTLDDLLERARKTPGKLSYGAPGVGTSGHTGGELLKSMAKVDILFVPYIGGPAAIQDLLGGRIDFIIANTSETMPLVKSGKVRALGVTSLKRIPQFPDVPTFDEQGVKGYEALAWGGAIASSRLPAALLDKLNAAMQRAVRTPAVVDSLVALGVEPATGSSADFKTLIASDTKKWAHLIDEAGIKKLD